MKFMEKLYYVVDAIRGEDEIICGKYEQNEAIKVARNEWSKLTSLEKEKHFIEIRDYEDDIESEDCRNYNYDLITWGYLIREKESGIPIDLADSEVEICEALADYIIADRNKRS